MPLPVATHLPEQALLAVYRARKAFTDCYALQVPGEVTLAQFIEAFYTSIVFRPERLLLGLIGMGSDNREVRLLAEAETDRFAAWHVEARETDQILLCDFQNRTRSWLMVAPCGGGVAATRLLFGSAVAVPGPAPRSRPFASASFRALLGFHKAYSRILLWSAARRLGVAFPAGD